MTCPIADEPIETSLRGYVVRPGAPLLQASRRGRDHAGRAARAGWESARASWTIEAWTG
jgi:hypothetical protein